MSSTIILDTPKRTISYDSDKGFATVIDYTVSTIDGSKITSTSYMSTSEIIFYEERDTMSFSFSSVHNIEVLHCILKAMGIENYTWLRYGYKQSRERIAITFTDDADYAFFKFSFFDQVKKANSLK